METSQIEARKPSGKRRLRSLSRDLDRRTSAAKAAFALKERITADLGGDAHLSAMQKALIHNVALLGAALDDLAVAYLAGENVDMTRFATLANAQRRLLADLGLERRAVEVHHHLSSYLAAKRRAQDVEPEDVPEPDGSDAP